MRGLGENRRRVADGANFDAADAHRLQQALELRPDLVVMDMQNMDAARRFASSLELAAARDRAGAIGPPDGVWFGPQQIE